MFNERDMETRIMQTEARMLPGGGSDGYNLAFDGRPTWKPGFPETTVATVKDSILAWDPTLNYGDGGWKIIAGPTTDGQIIARKDGDLKFIDAPTTDGMILIRVSGQVKFDFPKYSE